MVNLNKHVRLMFQDEAAFGRIGRLVRCWSKKGSRPIVPRHNVREFRYLFGAADPQTGDSCFRIYSHCDTVCMSHFLAELSQQFADDIILLVCDNATWHKAKSLVVPKNIVITHIPAYTPEMNPIEQLWDEIREKNFANQHFASLKDVIDRLCHAVRALASETIKSITGRKWVCKVFIWEWYKLHRLGFPRDWDDILYQ